MFIFKSKPKNPLDNEEIRQLFANIDLILANADKILQNEKYRNITVKGCGIDGIYIGHINLFLGDLISLWSNCSPWRNGQKFYYHLGGSPLSGMSFCTYWENGKIGCDRGDISAPSFWTLLKPAGVVVKNNTEQHNCISIPFPKRLASEMKIGDLLELLKKINISVS